MRDGFDQRLAAGAARLEQEAAVRSPAGVRARGDQRRRRHNATMAVAPVLVLAVAGTVGLTLRPSGGHSGQNTPGPPSSSSAQALGRSATPSMSAPRSSGTTSSGTTPVAVPGVTVDLAHYTLTVRDAQGKVVKAIPVSAGSPAHPTTTGTFTVVDKQRSKKISSSAVGMGGYDVTVSFFIDLGPHAPAIYGATWHTADLGKDNQTHGDIDLSPDDAAWLYNNLAVGATVRVG